MNLSTLRDLNKTVEMSKKQKVESSAVRIQREKIELQTRAMEKKKAAEDAVRTIRKTSAASKAAIRISIGLAAVSLAFLAGSRYYSLFLKPTPVVSLGQVVSIAPGSDDAREVEKLCREFFMKYKLHGIEGLNGFFAPLPPYIMESTFSSLSTISRDENFQISSISKDQRVSTYRVSCIAVDRRIVLTLDIALSSSGSAMIVGVSRG